MHLSVRPLAGSAAEASAQGSRCLAERLGNAVSFPLEIASRLNEDHSFSAVHGHVHGSNPFAKCDYPCIPTLEKLLGEFDLPEHADRMFDVVSGAKQNEVAVMNQLSSNLHFMMVGSLFA